MNVERGLVGWVIFLRPRDPGSNSWLWYFAIFFSFFFLISVKI